jgi:shikimate kinase
MGYYDYTPTLHPLKPISLIGFFGSGVQSMGQILSMRTGLTLNETDRWIEHVAGCSLVKMVKERGEEALRKVEREMVAKALRSGPISTIVLGDGALLDPYSRKAVLEQSFLVYIEAHPDILWERFQEERRLNPEWAYPPSLQAIVQKSDFITLFEDRRPLYEMADLTVNMNDSGTAAATETLVKELKAILGSSR